MFYCFFNSPIMNKKTRKGKLISRRIFLPIIGSSFMIPFLGYGNSEIENTTEIVDEEYETLLKPDGTTVKVKKSTLSKSKILEKNISNKSFLKWLGRKL